MTPPPASRGGAASHARFAGVFPLLRSSDCFRLVFAHSADHNPPYPPLVSALRLVCCLRVQILVVPLHVYTCSHRVFTHGAPCMGLLGPCRLKFFPRQSIYYHTTVSIPVAAFGSHSDGGSADRRIRGPCADRCPTMEPASTCAFLYRGSMCGHVSCASSFKASTGGPGLRACAASC